MCVGGAKGNVQRNQSHALWKMSTDGCAGDAKNAWEHHEAVTVCKDRDRKAEHTGGQLASRSPIAWTTEKYIR